MAWKGIAIGGLVGGLFGRSLWGVLFGAMIGYQINRRMERQHRSQRSGRRSAAPRDGRDLLAQAYSTLGARPSDSPDEIARKYRSLAKRHHPDALRARARPESEIAAATERMSRINAAWATVKSARGM